MVVVNGDTVITMTLKQLSGGIVALALLAGAAMWAANVLSMGNLKSDVADVRKAVTDAQARNADTQQSSVAADGELRRQLADLVAELKVTNTALSGLNGQMAGLSERMGGLDSTVQSVDRRLAEAELRQQNFESWVVTRLGPSSTAPITVPTSWEDSSAAVIKELTVGDDPLAAWLKAVKGSPAQ